MTSRGLIPSIFKGLDAHENAIRPFDRNVGVRTKERASIPILVIQLSIWKRMKKNTIKNKSIEFREIVMRDKFT